MKTAEMTRSTPRILQAVTGLALLAPVHVVALVVQVVMAQEAQEEEDRTLRHQVPAAPSPRLVDFPCYPQIPWHHVAKFLGTLTWLPG